MFLWFNNPCLLFLDFNYIFCSWVEKVSVMSEMHDEQSRRQLVIIGASAGGVEALIGLVQTLPADFSAPIVIAQHLDPSRPSYLASILERHTSLPVVIVQEQASLEDGIIYVVPANYHVRITDHDVKVSWDGQERPKPSIDRVLITASEVYGERLIAVILTGMGSDGQAGATEVKRLGGTVVIQDPATAAFPSMPRSLSPGIVDMSVPIERMGSLLHDLLTNAVVLESQTNAEEIEAQDQLLSEFLQQVRDVSGVDFSSYKRGTIRRRIQRRMVAVGAANLKDYIAYANRNGAEYQRLVSSFLIKVTEFMRDQELFGVLERDIIPALVDQTRQSPSKELRIWSAGCATGEEAYSLAILVAEVLGETLDSLNVKIFATDLDADAIAFARRGIYPASALVNLPPRLIKRYFIEHEDGYETSKLIRSLLVFGEHDLGQRPPFPRIDMVVCRNVLIYFTRELQQRTLRLFAFSLRNSGYLVLGKSETVTPFPDSFHSEYPQLKIFRRQGERLLIPPPIGGDASTTLTGQHVRIQRQRRNLSGELSRMEQELQRMRSVSNNLLLNLPIGVIVVNQRYDVQEINGAARRLLAVFQSAIGEDLVHLAGNLPPRVLRPAIDQTIQTQEPVIIDEIAMEARPSGEQTFLQISCYPQTYEQSDSTNRYVLLLIQDMTRVVQDRRKLQSERDQQQALTEQLKQQIAGLQEENRSLNAGNAELQQHIEELEQQQRQAEEQSQQQHQQVERLLKTNQELVVANEDLSNANQQLRMSNDEFLMTSEEAQATTEEIETLSEETQATNEELETLNEELQGTIEELTTTVNDLTTRNNSLQRQSDDNALQLAALQVMIEQMPDPAAVIAADGNIVLANEAYNRLQQERGSLADEAGRPLAATETPMARAARGEGFRMRYAHRDETGQQIWLVAQGFPLSGPEQQGGMVIIKPAEG
jgi:two-component system CheB/CheR fusion protein